ncbi:neutral/alkaline non-lysosomal ceramidase N-terminal domain-containing protein [Arundinibacter roseus]|uniref:Neutral/alkaline non-lysosomal ceramidase N-terminal domain-containing protein n=1 Tax=Arundinibacter roseus TaxID=2070510 RepID=A0A4V2X9N5_9BACT|nr:neutral/alkaline non-lysosomal ceramidase N-terminal domain-containing protein [Arundinibacter roseus]TDB64075.1 hypothetical protein EZE20_14120 [Arundinibacter roseus]
MKLLKISLKILAGFLLLILLLLVSLVTTLDYTPYQEMDYYRVWKKNISQIKSVPFDSTGQMQAGWAKVNFTPDSPTPMAGYGNRRGKHYESVHDSVFVRALVFDNGHTQAVILAADLLIIPPAVTDSLKARLPALGLNFDQVYPGATHTHNSIGGWGDTVTGKLFAGDYNPATAGKIADAMIRAIQLSQKNKQNVEIDYVQVSDSADVRNRLRGLTDTTVDPWVRNIVLRAADGQTVLLSSYAAHATVLNSKNLVLSRDYAGALVDSLEDGEADFAIYLAGAVGSMGPEEVGNTDFEEIGHQADGVETAIQSVLDSVRVQPTFHLQAYTVALPLREPSPRLNQTWALRSWVFRWAFGDYPAFVKVLRLGDILMVGMPCDFSGELMQELTAYASSKGLHLMVTSFNGAYAGYITDDRHFDKDQYETLTMSWFGPYNGAYFQEVVRDIIDRSTL